ncbi:glycosyltransferase family 2 protein [Pedobacter nototheniae]|uniref:glycosyltransferase family 2 protein n=1 Tax=Pedobacter nototheniae TaxID=2488994 RepID=UPI0013F43E68|nr:glycosyltransferase [Pedobacter nototheniae]
MVSIIIPAYNAASTILQTLNSVYQQSYQDFEVIVINDGSTDNTLQLLEAFEAKIKIISTPNKGVSYARNLGLSYALGDYIQYLDADDLLTSNKIELQINALSQNNADVAYGDWQQFTEVENVIKVTKTIKREIEGNIEIALFTDFWCPPAAILYSRNITSKIYWNQNLPVIQDARYFLDAAINGGKFIYTSGVMAQYRTAQKNSLSQRNELAFVADCLKNAEEIYKIWSSTSILPNEKKIALITVLRHCINRLSILNSDLNNHAISLLLEIEPNYIPEQKGMLKILSKVFGYRKAEYIAGIKRRLKK